MYLLYQVVDVLDEKLVILADSFGFWFEVGREQIFYIVSCIRGEDRQDMQAAFIKNGLLILILSSIPGNMTMAISFFRTYSARAVPNVVGDSRCIQPGSLEFVSERLKMLFGKLALRTYFVQ